MDPETAVKALAQWDAGAIVHTIDLGGMGPGYEQCIHISIFEIIRDHAADQPLESFDADGEETTKRWWRWADDTLDRINGDLGLSGAQWGAAKAFAYRAIKYGWREMISRYPQDRRTMVSRHFPKAPALPANVA